ncbi:hypothetical protein PVAND_015474 [Polypedilum vanderplanki]|uniref:Uncharacterized protein n=1 Tax=Polypedilum vanderplanki TaxID=319348 RepID=A0A9J6BD61_POLVA|nr:hypothetical protein PVAND_015474 [Polypedilum vanderplanki]
MNEYRNKINNSYESSSSGSSNSVGDNNIMHNSINFDTNDGLANLLLPSKGSVNFELYNTSAEEGIFPNVVPNCTIAAPSYEPEYDYYNQYSTQPLVYSWMPIVPGFNQDGTDNLHKFDHIIKKQPQPLNISGNDANSSIISDQNKLNSSDHKIYILNNSNGMNFNHQLDDSCNAIDFSISCNNQTKDFNLDLSFNGKISELASSSAFINDEDVKGGEEKVEDSPVLTEQFSIVELPETLKICSNDGQENDEKKAEDSEMERLRNESFELLKKEDSSKMLYLNEKSPEIVESCRSIEEQSSSPSNISLSSPYKKKISENGVNELPEQNKIIEVEKENIEIVIKPNSPNNFDYLLLSRFKKSLADKPHPVSISELPLSLSEMLAMYNKNLKLSEKSFKVMESDYVFRPTHSITDIYNALWPDVMKMNGLGLMYNRNNDCEEIELLTLKYSEKFIKTETASSFNHKIGPSSAKKRAEKLKLLTQSPGRRLSHLANRRKVFSSANLKSTSTSHGLNRTFSGSGQMLIDKSKLYKGGKKRNSAKKTTPGRKGSSFTRLTPSKKKTPPSSKRQTTLSVFRTISPAAAPKRALFNSPVNSALPSCSRDLPKRITELPKRLFSPAQKRKRSPSPNIENRFGKSRRLESPSKVKSVMRNLSTTASLSTASSTSSLDVYFKKTQSLRSHSEMNLNKSTTFVNENNLGFRKPMSETEKKKLLWATSSALQAKKISRDHDKFKEYMSILCKLVKKIFTEFYNPQKSMSSQMTKFANLMVYYVIQGKSFDEIYAITKSRLENPVKLTGYIGREEFEKNRLVRSKSSLLMLSESALSLNGSLETLGSDIDISGSDTSLNQSSSKSNISGILCENQNRKSNENSAKKLFGLSDSNLMNHVKTSTPSSNILKAKRQISF